MTFLKRGGAFGAFSWVTLSSDCLFELQWVNQGQPIGHVSFVKVSIVQRFS